MMNKDEAVMKLAKVAGLSIAHAEDLYDSFFEKPVVPQYVADWYEEHKNNFESGIYYLIRFWDEKERTSDFCKWFDDTENEAIKTLVNMHQFGYEVESEPRYTVRVKGIDGYSTYLNRDTKTQQWLFASKTELERFRARHTRKELGANGFGWVFSCPGVEVKEVDDGND